MDTLGKPPPPAASRELARTVLSVFLLTFLVSRPLVFLIMGRALPDLYLYACCPACNAWKKSRRREPGQVAFRARRARRGPPRHGRGQSSGFAPS